MILNPKRNPAAVLRDWMASNGPIPPDVATHIDKMEAYCDELVEVDRCYAIVSFGWEDVDFAHARLA